SSHLVLRNISENIGEKETGKGGAEFPPDPLSAPASFRSRPLEKNRRNDLFVLLSHYEYWTESLEQVLKFWLQIFLKRLVRTSALPTACWRVTSKMPGL
ncbi:MAG: hypothetical protein KKG62_04245, partial [Actinobacteria bacterium]|nr:hypothetical protein [Actinomycetota bacterium]